MRRVVLLPTSFSKPLTGAEFSLQRWLVRAHQGPLQLWALFGHPGRRRGSWAASAISPSAQHPSRGFLRPQESWLDGGTVLNGCESGVWPGGSPDHDVIVVDAGPQGFVGKDPSIAHNDAAAAGEAEGRGRDDYGPSPTSNLLLCEGHRSHPQASLYSTGKYKHGRGLPSLGQRCPWVGEYVCVWGGVGEDFRGKEQARPED